VRRCCDASIRTYLLTYFLNRTESAEIIFTNCTRKHAEGLPTPIPDIRRVTSIEMLGVTMIGPIPWGHSGPLSRVVVVVVVVVDIDAQAACDATVATPGEW